MPPGRPPQDSTKLNVILVKINEVLEIEREILQNQRRILELLHEGSAEQRDIDALTMRLHSSNDRLQAALAAN